MKKVEQMLAEEIRHVLEFHRWGGTADGTTGGGTVYDYKKADIREDAHKLQDLCRRVMTSAGQHSPKGSGNPDGRGQHVPP